MEWTLVEKWVGAGKLPAFRRLIEGGAHARLASTASSLPDTVWASIYTGSNPAKLEKFFYVQYEASTLGLRNLSDDVVKRAPFWQHLNAAGLRTGIVDVPKWGVSGSLTGFQIANWGAHATKTARTSHPRELLAQVDARFGRHPVGDCDNLDGKPESLHRLRRRVVEGVHAHGELFRAMMREQKWDMMFTAFSGPHCIGHHFWSGVHGTDGREGNDRSAIIEGAIEEVYRAIDREVGEMLSLVDNETRVMAIAGHGMGPIFHASWNLPQILELWGYGRSAARRVDETDAPRDAQVNPWRILKMLVPGPVQYFIKGMLPQFLQDQLLFRWYRGGRKWDGCRAFAIPNNDSVGAIRISVKGRDRHGMVDPGEEYQRVCRDIVTALCELTDGKAGRPLVKRVTLAHEEFHGPFLEQLPDITVLWDQSFAWRTVCSPRFGTLRIRQQDSRTGSHTAHGFVLAMGPGVPAACTLPDGSIYDIAPTVLQGAGLSVPADFDGQPLRFG